MRQRRRRPPEPNPQPKEPPAAGTITGIAFQQRNNSRVNIEIDGKFAFGLHVDLHLDHHLAVGMHLSDQQIASLMAQDEIKRAIFAALNLISFRPRASGELATRLRQKGYAPESVEAAIERLHELHYLDDASFAERFVESRQLHRPRSAKLLERELRQKGVDEETVRAAVDDAGIDEYADALALARKRVGSVTELDEGDRRRLTGFLGRRGYGYDIIRRVLAELGTHVEADE